MLLKHPWKTLSASRHRGDLQKTPNSQAPGFHLGKSRGHVSLLSSPRFAPRSQFKAINIYLLGHSDRVYSALGLFVGISPLSVCDRTAQVACAVCLGTRARSNDSRTCCSCRAGSGRRKDMAWSNLTSSKSSGDGSLLPLTNVSAFDGPSEPRADLRGREKERSRHSRSPSAISKV